MVNFILAGYLGTIKDLLNSFLSVEYTYPGSKGTGRCQGAAYPVIHKVSQKMEKEKFHLVQDFLAYSG